MASEMLYPIMPMYLKSIGFSVVFIGILEGLAEATAGLSKGYFGKRSDVLGKRVPFVQLGYTLSALSKPLMAVFTFPLWIFFARTIDRLGKGIRTGARDALLSDESDSANKGKVFGFHRAADTFGAVLGPALALVFLYFHPENYKALFIWAVIPGLLAIGATFFLREKKREAVEKPPFSFFAFLTYWKSASPEFRKLVGGLLVFALFNSSDVFLLLKAKQSGLSDTMVIGIYIFYNLIYALTAFPLGALADKIGFRKMLVFGLLIFSAVYFGMGLTSNSTMIVLLFFLYGIYAAATEGVSKAWISTIADKKDTATAIGTYAGFQSVAALFASSFAGLIWYNFGSGATFISTGIVALTLSFYFLKMNTTQRVKYTTPI